MLLQITYLRSGFKYFIACKDNYFSRNRQLLQSFSNGDILQQVFCAKNVNLACRFFNNKGYFTGSYPHSFVP